MLSTFLRYGGICPRYGEHHLALVCLGDQKLNDCVGFVLTAVSLQPRGAPLSPPCSHMGACMLHLFICVYLFRFAAAQSQCCSECLIGEWPAYVEDGLCRVLC